MRKITLIVLGFAALVVAILGSVYLHLAIRARTEEYRARAELLAWTFADRVAFDLAQGNKQNLEFLTGTLVLGSVLYAQIVHEGQVLSEVNRLEEPLTTAPAPAGIWEIERRTSKAQAYWDIRRILPDGDGYVRFGLALNPLESAIRAQVLFVVGIGMALLTLVGLVSYWVHYAFTPVKQMAPRPADLGLESLSPIQAQVSMPIRIGELVIDEASKNVQMRGQQVELSPKEFELLRLLASEPDRVFSNQEILARIWPESHFATAQDVKQYIYFLRQKLEEDPKEPKLILTVRGFGYKLQP